MRLAVYEFTIICYFITIISLKRRQLETSLPNPHLPLISSEKYQFIDIAECPVLLDNWKMLINSVNTRK